MAMIEVSLNHPIWDGEEIRFKAGCDSSTAEGLKVTYPVDEEGALQSKTLVFKDAHGADISSTADVFSLGSYVTVVVDATNSAAYVQNADTNSYLESKVQSYTATLPASSWADNKQAVSVAGVKADNTVIVSPAPASHTAYAEAAVRCDAQSAGKLSFVCESAPNTDLTVNITVIDK